MGNLGRPQTTKLRQQKQAAHTKHSAQPGRLDGPTQSLLVPQALSAWRRSGRHPTQSRPRPLAPWGSPLPCRRRSSKPPRLTADPCRQQACERTRPIRCLTLRNVVVAPPAAEHACCYPGWAFPASTSALRPAMCGCLSPPCPNKTPGSRNSRFLDQTGNLSESEQKRKRDLAGQNSSPGKNLRVFPGAKKSAQGKLLRNSPERAPPRGSAENCGLGGFLVSTARYRKHCARHQQSTSLQENCAPECCSGPSSISRNRQCGWSSEWALLGALWRAEFQGPPQRHRADMLGSGLQDEPWCGPAAGKLVNLCFDLLRRPRQMDAGGGGGSSNMLETPPGS